MSEARYVLDASALLAAMAGEPGAQIVAERLGEACISAVNLSEVVAKLAERGMPDHAIAESLADLDLDVRVFDAEQAMLAGTLRNATRSRGLSLGDRACLALAGTITAIALTTDTAWAEVDIAIAVELAR